MKKIAICQSNYIPWKGYFDLINSADEFFLLDCVQYTKNDWRNRNIIKTQKGLEWITIPVFKESLEQKIIETRTANDIWRKKHWKSIQQNYAKTGFFKNYKDIFERLYLDSKETSLSMINYGFISEICAILGIGTKLHLIKEEIDHDRNERLINICKQSDAAVYISGPAAKDYLDEKKFMKDGISVEFMDYSSYPQYRQLYGKFEHTVSVLDLLFNEGENSKRFMKSFVV